MNYLTGSKSKKSVASQVLDIVQPAVTAVQQKSEDVSQGIETVKQAAIGYGAATVALQAIIAGGILFIAYQMTKRR